MSKVAFGSCWSKQKDFQGHKLPAQDCVGFFAIGDWSYTNSVPADNFGASGITQHTGDDFTEANFTKFFAYQALAPGYKWIKARMPFYLMPDDHEYPGDNWDHTVTQAESGTSGPMTGATQTDVDTAFINSITAIAPYMEDNPANNDAGVTAQAPSEAAAAAANYQPLYFRVTHGYAEYFFIDCISHRDPLATADSASKTMLGSVQKQWLKDRLKASTAVFKVIVSGKKTFAATEDNYDIWASAGGQPGYSTERDELLDYIDAATDWAVSGGVLWVAGDRHTPQIIASYKSANVSPYDIGGADVDHTCLVACPTGTDINVPPGAEQGYIKIVHEEWGQVVLIGEDDLDRYTLTYYSMNTSRKLWTCHVKAGENKMSYQ